MNVVVSVKNQMIGVLFLEDDYMRDPSTYDCGCNKTCKNDEYLVIKNW